ncbi:MAG: cytochrome P450, partial [Acidobacteria bacterium]|nr:cytochrome P450 [Acidobacteriota bacterium]
SLRLCPAVWLFARKAVGEDVIAGYRVPAGSYVLISPWVNHHLARSWSEPHSTSIPGQSSCIAELGGGRMLIIYSHRENTDQPGLKVVLSEDGGTTWQLDQPLVVWDAYGKEALGVARSATYPSSHDAIAYGAPKIVRLDDTAALASFWCTQGGDIHCRWCRIRLA